MKKSFGFSSRGLGIHSQWLNIILTIYLLFVTSDCCPNQEKSLDIDDFVEIREVCK